jgi:hypothetical protein
MARSKTTRIGDHVSAGDGWGGPAKGPGTTAKPAPQFAKGNTASVGHAPRPQSTVDRAQALKDHLFTLAQSAERQETQVQAAKAWLDRHEGLPLARTLNHNTDDLAALDDQSLADRRAALERAIGSGAGGTASPELPQKPGSLVH